MSRYHGNDETCESCGMRYRNFRTGLTFSDVRMMLWVGSDDYTQWKYKRRNTVLGLWHALKQRMWDQHQWDCMRAKNEEGPTEAGPSSSP